MAQAHRFRVALVQLAVGKDKATNLIRAAEKVREASQNGANIVALPVELDAVVDIPPSLTVSLPGMFQQSIRM